MTGRSRGNTASLSISIEEAGVGGGNGDMLRRIPVISLVVSKGLGQNHAPEARTLNVTDL